MSELISVNFGEPMPVFPLWDAVLLPHAILPLHIFEPRYRQMVEEATRGTSQIAMALLRSPETPEASSMVGLRPAVCIGQIVEHQRLANGRHNILLHGVCRAKITALYEPEGTRLYRQARLEPLECVEQAPTPMPEIRARLHELLHSRHLRRMRCVDSLLEWFDREDVSTHALLELLGFALVRDSAIRYQLLEEPDARRRARVLTQELRRMHRLVAQAEGQSQGSWPKGVSWN